MKLQMTQCRAGSGGGGGGGAHRPANLFWKKTLNVRLKNLEFIAKTLRHAHDPITFVQC